MRNMVTPQIRWITYFVVHLRQNSGVLVEKRDKNLIFGQKRNIFAK